MTEPDPVAALAAQLEELRGQLARYTGETGHLRAKLAQDTGQVVMLRLEIKQLGEKIKAAIARRNADEPPAPYWLGLSRDEYGTRLAELCEWVERFLRPHYPGYMARLPHCWANHPEAAWELSTLQAEWGRIYGDPDNRDLQAALIWHDKFFPGVLARLKASIKCDESGCRMTQARPRG